MADEVTPGGSAASLANRRPAAVAPKANTAPLAFAATGFAVDPEGTTYDDPAALAAAIAKKRLGMSHIPPGVKDDYVHLATYQKPEFAHQLGSKAEDNGLVFRQAQREASALVASGAVCAPLDPVWDKITLGEQFDADLEQALPTIGAPQGGIRFRPYSKPDVTRMLAGVGHYLYGARETGCEHPGRRPVPAADPGEPEREPPVDDGCEHDGDVRRGERADHRGRYDHRRHRWCARRVEPEALCDARLHRRGRLLHRGVLDLPEGGQPPVPDHPGSGRGGAGRPRHRLPAGEGGVDPQLHEGDRHRHHPRTSTACRLRSASCSHSTPPQSATARRTCCRRPRRSRRSSLATSSASWPSTSRSRVASTTRSPRCRG